MDLDLTTDWLAHAPLTPDERRAWQTCRTAVKELQAQNKALAEKIRQLEADQDNAPLLLTRTDFNREVARMLAFDERYGGTSSVLYLDIEGLGEAFGVLGSVRSQALLEKIGGALGDHVRKSDIVGRLAPDEFGVMLMRCPNDMAWRKGESLACVLEDLLARVQGLSAPLKVAYGAYTFGDKEDPASENEERALRKTLPPNREKEPRTQE